MITGPSEKVTKGSTVKLLCTVTTMKHQPSWMNIRKSTGPGEPTKPKWLYLPNGEEQMGMVFQIRNATHADAGNYTCEATWESPHVSRKVIHMLIVACKYLTVI